MKKKTPMTRSENMGRIKGKNTTIEIFFRKLLWHRGIRYRINYRKLPGSPDIYIPSMRTAVFINGCFWHRHEGCRLASTPSTNAQFWQDKFTRNTERDIRKNRELMDLGYRTVTIWECEVRKLMKGSKEEADLFIEERLGIPLPSGEYQDSPEGEDIVAEDSDEYPAESLKTKYKE